MKVFADLTALFKVAGVCLIIGFILGALCLTGPSWLPSSATVPAAPASSEPTEPTR